MAKLEGMPEAGSKKACYTTMAVAANEMMPDEWKGLIMAMIYKGSGQKAKCEESKGVLVGSSVGKVWAGEIRPGYTGWWFPFALFRVCFAHGSIDHAPLCHGRLL